MAKKATTKLLKALVTWLMWYLGTLAEEMS